jgi:hypothetical protein
MQKALNIKNKCETSSKHITIIIIIISAAAAAACQ